MRNNHNTQPRANNSSLPLAGSSGNELTFQFNTDNIHVEVIEGNPWFLAKDVCDALGIVNSKDAVAKLENYQKLRSVVTTSGQGRNMNFVNESGLYSLIFQSRKKEAKAFQKWVTCEVLPEIRRTGTYGYGLRGIESQIDDGTIYYCLYQLCQRIGRKMGGSLYSLQEKYKKEFKWLTGRLFVSERYAKIMMYRRSATQILKDVKETQLALFTDKSAEAANGTV